MSRPAKPKPSKLTRNTRSKALLKSLSMNPSIRPGLFVLASVRRSRSSMMVPVTAMVNSSETPTLCPGVSTKPVPVTSPSLFSKFKSMWQHSPDTGATLLDHRPLTRSVWSLSSNTPQPARLRIEMPAIKMI